MIHTLAPFWSFFVLLPPPSPRAETSGDGGRGGVMPAVQIVSRVGAGPVHNQPGALESHDGASTFPRGVATAGFIYFCLNPEASSDATGL